MEKKIFIKIEEIKDILIEEYRNLGPFTPKTILQLSPKQSFIVIYLQELIGNALDDDDIERTVIHSGYSEEKDGYNERKAFLLKRLKSLCDVNPYVDYELSKRTVDGLEAIPDKYFISDVEISACFSDLDNNCFETLMQVFDENSGKENVRYLYFLRVKIEGLSSGEACYLDLFSSLYYALNDSYNNGVRKKIVLLLDEPDARFHPEWSRRFVETLCDWLNGTMFKQYKYQLIITTHSPLMISDVFKEDVILLDRKEDKFEVRKSKFGLMSGINDILIDSFFTDSLFGSNAVKFVETIIHDMDDVKHFECNSEIIKKKISWIDDEYIKMRLWRKYQYTKAKLEMEKINDKN